MTASEMRIVLPMSMTMLTVEEALDGIRSLVHDMRESEALCARLGGRLRFLSEHVDPVKQARDALPLFTVAVKQTIELLKKFGEKKALQVVVASRALREGVRRVHAAIDRAFVAAGLGDTPEMTAWRESEAVDIEEQLTRLTQLVSDPKGLISGLSASQDEEARLNLRLEITQRSHTAEFQALLERAFEQLGPDEIESVPGWYVNRDDVEIAKEPFDLGEFGTVHRAKWGPDNTVVCAKKLFRDRQDSQKKFMAEMALWHRLSHPNVIAMFGGCHVGSPLFFISELATQGNFVDYFRDPANKRRMWRLFYQAATGLEYVHREGIVHANLRCNNILVGDDNKAKLCDFGFSATRSQSVSRSLTAQTDSVRWLALECLLGEAYPSFASDVYALGMCIIEAVSDEAPWGMTDDDTILENLLEGTFHPRPDGLSDKQWDLVTRLCAIDMAERIELSEAIDILKELADDEECEEMRLNSLRHDRLCPECQYAVPCDNVFCGRCGERLGTYRKTASAHDVSKP